MYLPPNMPFCPLLPLVPGGPGIALSVPAGPCIPVGPVFPIIPLVPAGPGTNNILYFLNTVHFSNIPVLFKLSLDWTTDHTRLFLIWIFWVKLSNLPNLTKYFLMLPKKHNITFAIRLALNVREIVFKM